MGLTVGAGRPGVPRLIDLAKAIWKAKSPFAESWRGQSPAIGGGEAVEHEAHCGQGDHRLGDLG